MYLIDLCRAGLRSALCPILPRLTIIALAAFIAFAAESIPHNAIAEPGAGTAGLTGDSELEVVLVEEIASLEGDPDAIREGQRVFNVHCWACHGTGGQGLIGPSFVDNETLHGDEYEDYVNTVTHGVDGKPMAAWGPRLPRVQILQVVAYVHSLKGTMPGRNGAGGN